MTLLLRPWFIAVVLVIATAIVFGIVYIRNTDAQFVTPTSGVWIAIDCDTAASGVQDDCVLPASATSVTVAVVLGNADVPTSNIGSFQFHLIANQRFVDPATGADADKNANPDFNEPAFPTGTWSCTPPAPTRDANSDPLVADSFLSCFQSVYGRAEPFNAGSQTRAALVRYNILRTGSSDVTLDAVLVGDNDGNEVMSCNYPGGEVATQCFGARIQVGAQTPTATSTTTFTPPPGVTLTATPSPTATMAENPTVTPMPTSTATPITEPPVDTDMDGVLDVYELAHPCMNVLVADGQLDPDNDGAINTEEGARLTDACAPDTDTDTMNDGYEMHNACLDPLVPALASDDRDADTLTDLQEHQRRTLPCDADSDRDGYSDGLEVTVNEDPLFYCSIMRADVNGTRGVNSIDLMLVARQFGPTPPGNPRMDQGNDAQVNSLDLQRVARNFGLYVAACE